MSHAPRAPVADLVVKIGGSRLINLSAVGADLSVLRSAGQPMVVTHGAADAITTLAARLGVTDTHLVSPTGVRFRRTTQQMLEVVNLALVGQARTDVLLALGAHGLRAIGLSGADGGVLRAHRKDTLRAMVDGRPTVIRGDHGGRVNGVDAGLIRALLSADCVPVISPPAVSEDFQLVNVNADRAAAAIAVSTGASSLVLLTSAPGVLADPADDRTLLAEVEVNGSGKVMGAVIAGGMAVKLIAASEALAGGVRRVIIADGRTSRPVLDALAGAGTRVRLLPGAVASERPVPSRREPR